MGFLVKSTQLELGQTQIENMFIRDFVPMASGAYVKVYITAFYFASSSSSTLSNEGLAKHLKMPLSDVVEAFQFWESKHIVKLHNQRPDEPHEFDVEFLSIRELYITNNYKFKSEISSGVKTSDRLYSAMSNPQIKELLREIQLMVRRPLTSKETNMVLNFISEKMMDFDVIYRAFFITFEERNKRKATFEYVEGIINKWYDKRIFTIADLVAYESQHDERYAFYREIMTILGHKNMSIKDDLRSVINTYVDNHDFSEAFVIAVIKELSKRTKNVSAGYLQKVFQDLATRGIITIEKAKQHFESLNRQSDKKQRPKTKTQNFAQDTLGSMSESEIEAIIKRQNSLG